MKRTKLLLLIIAFVVFAASSAFADYSYTFNADTSSLAGQTGYIELQYNPGIAPGASNAVVSNYMSDATLLGSAAITGDVTGQLPSSVIINNTNAWNDYYQQVTFGTNLKFDLNLTGAAGNTFALSFYSANGTTPVLTNDPNGFATTIDVNANGAVVNKLSDQVTVASTPIPAAAWLFGSGLMGLAGIRRKLQNNG
jgi:hypothetical protein